MKCEWVAFQQEFKKMGGELRDEEKVTRVDARHNQVTVVTERSSYQCRSLVLCMGAWCGRFLEQQWGLKLPLQVFTKKYSVIVEKLFVGKFL